MSLPRMSQVRRTATQAACPPTWEIMGTARPRYADRIRIEESWFFYAAHFINLLIIALIQPAPSLLSSVSWRVAHTLHVGVAIHAHLRLESV